MRLPVLLLVLPLLVPVAADAQLRPRVRPGASDPTRPQPAPEPIEPVGRVLAYQRLRLAVESYPQASAVWAPGFSEHLRSWTGIGWGTRADYRMTHRWSAVGELSASWAGSPVTTWSLELGTRYRPPIVHDRVLPFVDMRLTWMSAYERYSVERSSAGALVPFGARAGGAGALAGVGMEYLLSPRWSAVTGAALTHNRMQLDGVRADGTSGSFGMSSVRAIAGLRYNRIQVLRP